MEELPSNIQAVLGTYVETEQWHLDNNVSALNRIMREACESPAEQLMVAALAAELNVHLVDGPTQYRRGRLVAQVPVPLLERYFIQIFPQHELELEGRKYRADFMIRLTRANDYRTENAIFSVGRSYLDFVLEVDGHDYHERTKEQAKRDRSRDRAMFKAGYTVWRFTASEVYNDPAGAAHEVQEYLSAQAKLVAQEIGS